MGVLIHYLFIVTLIGYLCLSDGQVIQDGECDENLPNHASVATFDPESFSGLWVERSQVRNPWQSGDCSTMRFTNTGNNNYDVHNVILNDNFLEEYNGTAILEEDTAKFSISSPNFGDDTPYWILMTNYNIYALAYSCETIIKDDNTTERSINLWKLGRQTTYPNEETFHAMMDVYILNTFNIQAGEVMYNIDHTEEACFALPELEEGQPIIVPGQCEENVTVVENFNFNYFSGLWHDIANYEVNDGVGTCKNNYYTFNEDGTVLTLHRRVIDEILQSSEITNLRAISEHGIFIHTQETESGPIEREIRIISTDYNNYAITYSCENVGDNQRRIYSSIMTRSRQVTAETQAEIDEVIDSFLLLNHRYYETTDQSDEGCFHYPVHVENQPVVFRGQCDMSIRNIEGLDFVRFSGLWHEIEGYPSNIQQGTCNNVHYTVDEEETGTMTFVSAEVFGERLQELGGRSFLEDETIVTEFSDGSRFNTWILGTDYESYALVYSCINLNPDERAVWAWKLSRTKQMPTIENEIINTLMDPIQVLDQRYFESKDQSQEGCFFYPTPVEGQHVIFPGQCDENIPVISDFEMERFAGNWNEIQSYPKLQQPGECIILQFSNGNNNIELYITEVRDQFLNEAIGSMTPITTDNSSSFRATITIDEVEISAPFWILGTDYDNYALAYSCVNLDDDWRGIWSWKLSRTRTMSEEANSAIDAITSSINVLGNEYFENVAQTDESCFYLPDLEPGEPVIIIGQCDPNIPVVQDFDPSSYSGLWHYISSYPADHQDGTCNDVTYNVNENNDIMEVYNTQVANDQTLNAISGTGVLATTDGSAKLIVSYPGRDDQELWILDTDYESYSLVYSCENINAEYRRVWSWKLSRNRTLSDEADVAINEAIDTVNVLNNRYYQPIDNSVESCFYFPEPVENQPVVFRGQCDTNIPVVTNFNAERFSGLWHEIESYPSVFHRGTCNNADYTLHENGTFSLYNTQVNNQILDYSNGEAIIASDGSAVLEVTLPVPNSDEFITTTYWVLATDYDDYALVYSCENIDDNHRAVWSWKLSRNKQLSANANAAIENVVATVQVMRQDYYQIRDQSREGCFFYPEVTGQPVIFPGQCDENLPVLDDFDEERFLGLWHEIEAYPKVQISGQCINFNYRRDPNNALELFTTQVIGQRLGTATGAVSTSGDSKLTIRINLNGQDLVIPYWILATDYDNYALAYTCINIDSDWREIWNWKLGRNKELTSDSSTAINNAMDSIDILEQRYFETNDQSDEECFYLPELTPNEPVTFFGQCDESIPAVANFDLERYSGLWHEIESYYDEFQDGDCQDSTYSLSESNNLELSNSQVVDERLELITGPVELESSDGSAKLRITLTRENDTITVPYWILSTDYDSYSLVYSCYNLSPERRRIRSWKLSRTRQLSEEANNVINEVIDSIPVLNDEYYNRRDQSNEACFYYPIPVQGQPVTFRGQCDENIPAIPDFDLERFMGIWHDIESYPQLFQYGTCPNANYSLNDDQTVRVINTQVSRQELETAIGSARLASGDGSGEFIVSFPSNDGEEFITTSYWVLATDYDDYALVYSCENIDDNHRAVWSWKLSRNKQLSANANAAIDNVVATVQVMRQDYYEIRDQSREGCFFYPEVTGQPVIFPGQCDENLPVLDDFDEERFLGLWHEIESYPKVQLSGQCINFNYRRDPNNALELFTTQVIDQRLGTATGAVSTSDDSKLTIRINLNGQDLVIPYWILATDYDNYALAYTCINIDNDWREIWSWKLGRNKELTSDLSTAINNAMSSIDILEQRYFETNDQSDDECFYLPELTPNEPVTFFGQCDESIPAVANFDLERYSGLWHEIESYYDEFQDGDCQDSTYSLSESNNLELSNSQVVDERLELITGPVELESSDGSAKLRITLTRENETIAVPYWILSTDYDSYSLVYSCYNLSPERRRVRSWKLSRTRQLSEEANNVIDEVIDSIPVLNDEYYNRRDQSNEACFYYPIPVQGQPVTFRGQCDENIPAVPDFDLERFMGIWHDIESYPQLFQYGTCPTANYSLNDDQTLRVTNTQVSRQELETAIGSARLASGDGSGKLIVSFPSNDSEDNEFDYWVLATDYTNYALVYSCSNIEPDRRGVSSWKLSRETSLSYESEAAINAIVNSIQVLHQDYYERKGHSEEDCFYYPDNYGGPVELDGQCLPENEVPAIENFNPDRFSGTWHEISRFPSELQSGVCTDAILDFTNLLGSFSMTIIDEERLNSIVGQVTADDNRGVLSLMVWSGTNPLIFYVLDTDYDEFALIYGCRNINEDKKQVYSWKLSRTKEGFSDATDDHIEELVHENVDLFHRYYEETDQSLYGCFYYPVYDNPSSITLPGPCNNTIVGKPDFNIASFQGRWFELSRYPHDSQIGQCTQAFLLETFNLEAWTNFVVSETLNFNYLDAATFADDGSGVLIVPIEVDGEQRDINLYILETDYQNFALMYSCQNLPSGDREVRSWKLSRQRILSPEHNAIVSSVIDDTQGLLNDYYIETDHSDEACFYIPTPEINTPVVFRGQCDESIRGVEDFDMDRYIGWWHEIERYPLAPNGGECISTQYEVSGGQYTFVNTSVLNSEGTLFSGNLQVSADAPGRLRKSFSNGQVIDVWVLATDYATYSLLYLCENIDDEYRRVWSAKHSKSRQLTAVAQVAMQPYIDSISVLDDRFYFEVDQSDFACFHYPDQTGSSVVIPGQCDANIPVVQEFDMVSFTGIWFQIETYPQPANLGFCSGVKIEGESEELELISFDVIDDELNRVDGTVSVAEVDGSGRLSVTLPIFGTNDTSTTDLYILATDYASYFIAYTCINLPNGFQRQIGAWKFSRTRTLPASAVTAINNMISQREELYQPYFLLIDQEEDCPVPLSGHLVKCTLLLIMFSVILQGLL